MFYKEIPAVVSNMGTQESGKFILHVPEYNCYKVTILLEEKSYSAVSKYHFFNALCELRKMMLHDGIVPLCKGAAKYVWPSGMQADMGSGLTAYELKPGDRRGKPVDVFEVDTTIEVVHPDEQRAIRTRLSRGESAD